MDAASEPIATDMLGDWMTRKRRVAPAIGPPMDRGPGLRFAFYGRMSTVEYQDRGSSQAWQREAADQLVVDCGAVVAEFFDQGCSRRLPWSSRPAAAALLAEVSLSGRRFDAVVVGEYERAFSGDQSSRVMTVLDRAGVQMWLPEAGGLVERDNPLHQALVTVLGAQLQREVLRSRHRNLAAMRAQACEQGRFLGGRPPYG